jgi:hypothetical protein
MHRLGSIGLFLCMVSSPLEETNPDDPSCVSESKTWCKTSQALIFEASVESEERENEGRCNQGPSSIQDASPSGVRQRTATTDRRVNLH